MKKIYRIDDINKLGDVYVECDIKIEKVKNKLIIEMTDKKGNMMKEKTQISLRDLGSMKISGVYVLARWHHDKSFHRRG